MLEFAVDLHIHSPHSISVSKNMTIPNLAKGAQSKGIDILGTGDATQPNWLEHTEKTLKEHDGILTYDGISFIPTVEIEDGDAIHHVVILPDFESVKRLRESIKLSSPNLDHEWGGRPRVNLKAEEIAGLVRDSGGMIGPAHAFTPFRGIFREGRFDSIEACYGSEADHIHFLELGLSADSEIADYISSLRRLTYISSSDAHSPTPDKLGREFVKFNLEAPIYDEIRMGLKREKGRYTTLNVGLAPQLGKYYLSFCSKCRRTLVILEGDKAPTFDDMNIYVHLKDSTEQKRLLSDIGKRGVKCPHDGKSLRLGVRDRAAMLGDITSIKPKHRPLYLHMPPLLDLIQSALGTKSNKVKSVKRVYEAMIQSLGTETQILTSIKIEDVEKTDERISRIICSYRNGEVDYIPGGGGRYGQIKNTWDE
ncbi:MAG: phosphotransferase [Candidatus Thorarchaeota archaeon]|nr:phosphotransferase [Candidatus Thorarchaeota archaeon]